MSEECLVDVTDDLADAKLGHARRTKRLTKFVKSVQRNPSKSIPQACGSEAESEAAYRFLDNDAMTAEAILAPHHANTAKRAAVQDTVLVVHDTTTFSFGGGIRPGLGVIDGGKDPGFYLHSSLCVGPTGEPLGVQNMSAWIRQDATLGKRSRNESQYDPDSESLRWHDGVHAVDDAIRSLSDFGSVVPEPRVIHVADREADIALFLADLREHHRSFVVRSTTDRRLEPGRKRTEEKLYRSLKEQPVLFTYSVPVVVRKRQSVAGSALTRSGRPGKRARETVMSWAEKRIAILEVRSLSTRIYPAHGCRAEVPDGGIGINAVFVQEVNPPADVEPICWYLVTDQSIDTEEDVCFVIHCYQLRWLIEEYHKALKTGCRFEMHQFKNGTNLMRMLAVVVPVAVQMLRFRWFDRESPDTSAYQILTQEQIHVLRLHQEKRGKPMSPQPTAREVLRVIASLGGHLRHNGPPGWLVLFRGYVVMSTLLDGYLLAQTHYAERRIAESSHG